MSLFVNGMKEVLNFFYDITIWLNIPSYGLAIIFLTVTIKMLLYPLSVKQMRSMKITQHLQPKIKEAQEKYKNDPQKAQAAVMEIYKQYGASPLTGCLPLLIQMPILIALYQALYKFDFPVKAHAAFLWITNLKEPDPLYLMPILAAVTTFVMQRMTTNLKDPTQRTMLFGMPLFIGFITYKFPAGLGLYWVMTNIVGAAQQYFINRQPLPDVIKEEVVQDEGNDQKRKNSGRSNKGSVKRTKAGK
ncbi:YidC/Oxa1 family membrane protein insertase [Phosphitispora sp. TUW77]|uniref:YidC/Oxa1 family membrane protein insertase n=1 Tax=Phosphitispora sp. TUW77 TaxID=3152361 RepID=UPI003AB26223